MRPDHPTHPDIPLDVPYPLRDFETNTADLTAQITGKLDDFMSGASIDPRSIETVFLIGGTSKIPSLRGEFVRRFSLPSRTKWMFNQQAAHPRRSNHWARTWATTVSVVCGFLISRFPLAEPGERIREALLSSGLTFGRGHPLDVGAGGSEETVGTFGPRPDWRDPRGSVIRTSLSAENAPPSPPYSMPSPP